MRSDVFVSMECSIVAISATVRSNVDMSLPLAARNARANSLEPQFDATQLIALRRVSEIAFAPGGDWIAVAVQRLDADGAKYVTDLWRLPRDGGPAVQLTRGEHRDTAPCFRADG